MLFHQKKYDQALLVFEQPELYQQNPAGALLGRLFCAVALGRSDAVDHNIALIQQKFEKIAQCQPPSKQSPLTSQEQQAAYKCRHKIREAANEMRQTVEKLVRETVPGVFNKIKALRQLYPFIDALERVGLDCCKNNPSSWDCCLSPLTQQMEAWKSLGIKDHLD